MKSPHILIIDDEASVRHSLEAYLEDLEYQISTAENAETGLQVLEDQSIALAVVDMRLPGMDGNTFIRQAIRINPSLRFIIHTGSKQYMLPDDLLSMGLTRRSVLLKPVKNMNIIHEMIQQTLDGDAV